MGFASRSFGAGWRRCFFCSYNKLIPPKIPSTSEEKLSLKKDFDANQIIVNSNDTSSKEEKVS